MIELRWFVEEWDEYRDGLKIGIKHTEPPVLQYRVPENMGEVCNGIYEAIWGEWTDVPTVTFKE